MRPAVVVRRKSVLFALFAWAQATVAAAQSQAVRTLSAVEGEAPRHWLRLLATVPIDGAEIPAHCPATGATLVTAAAGILMLHLGDGSRIEVVRTVDPAVAGEEFARDGASATHVAVDPAGRRFAAAAVVPEDHAGVPGRVLFLATTTGEPLASLIVGYHPDCVAFTPDGSRLLVANEGEPMVYPDGSVCDPPGSVSVIDLSFVADHDDLALLSRAHVRTVYFEGPALDAAMGLPRDADKRLRIHPRCASSPASDLEPEYIVGHGERAWVTLQENNAIAVLNLATFLWERIAGLGTIHQTIDASDRDGGALVRQPFDTLPMPDQMALIEGPSGLFILTANEGDARGRIGDAGAVLGDRARFADLAEQGRLSPADAFRHDRSEAGVGRLLVCGFWGDIDGDGRLEAPAAQGSRSISVHRADTLVRVADTGSRIESAIAAMAPDIFNASDESPLTPDGRSPERGPEPEGIAIGVIEDVRYAFVSCERPGAVAIVDVTIPSMPRLVAIEPAAREGLLGPEGLCFISSSRGGRGRDLLVVAFEGSGKLAVYEVAAARDRSR